LNGGPFRWTIFGLVILASLAGCKKRSTYGRLPIPDASAVTQILSDFQMQDILEGTKNMVVEAPEGRIAEQQREALVDKPRISFYKQGAISSTLNAPQGKIGLDTHAVVVWGGVTVVTPDSATLTTESLRYNPTNRHLMTDDTVRLEKPTSITIGKGLDAEPDLSRVRIGHQKIYFKSNEHK